MSNAIRTAKIAELSVLRARAAVIQNEMDNYTLDPEDFDDQFRDMLRETYPSYMGFSPDQILSTLDPIQYNDRRNSYVDAIDATDTDGYIELEEELEKVNHEIQFITEFLAEE